MDTITIEVEGSISNPYCLNKLKRTTDEFEQTTFKGYLGKMLVISSSLKTVITGSIPKHLQGNNIHPLKYAEIIDGVMSLGKQLGIDIRKGTIRRLDISTVINVPDVVKSYFIHLAYAPKKKRTEFINSLYFISSTKISFYDKIKEMKSKSDTIPINYRSGHWMRIEVTIKALFIRKWSEKNLNEYLTVSDLMTPEIYIKLINECQKQVASIVWDDIVTCNEDQITSIKELKDYLIVKGIEQSGGMAKVLSLIDEFKYKNKSWGPVQRSRCKAGFKELCSKYQTNIEASIKEKHFYDTLNEAYHWMREDVNKNHLSSFQ